MIYLRFRDFISALSFPIIIAAITLVSKLVYLYQFLIYVLSNGFFLSNKSDQPSQATSLSSTLKGNLANPLVMSSPSISSFECASSTEIGRFSQAIVPIFTFSKVPKWPYGTIRVTNALFKKTTISKNLFQVSQIFGQSLVHYFVMR